LAITKLPLLWQLHINFNQLSSIPEEIGMMKNLKDLAINYNAEIRDLPPVFWTGLKALKQMAIVGTYFNDDPSKKKKIEDLKKRGIKFFWLYETNVLKLSISLDFYKHYLSSNISILKFINFCHIFLILDNYLWQIKAITSPWMKDLRIYSKHSKQS